MPLFNTSLAFSMFTQKYLLWMFNVLRKFPDILPWRNLGAKNPKPKVYYYYYATDSRGFLYLSQSHSVLLSLSDLTLLWRRDILSACHFAER